MEVWADKTIFLEVGEKFMTQEGKMLTCESLGSPTCVGCYFDGLYNGGDLMCKSFICTPSGREDKQHVIFVAT